MPVARVQFFTVALVFCNIAYAQHQTIQSADTIEATPIASFSDETGAWPTSEVNPEILHSGAISLYETLDRIPGLSARGSLSKTSPAIIMHGSASATRTLGLYDGIPLNLSDSAGAQELLIPREALGNIMLLKGPASLFYGSGAMSGAINFLPATYSRPRLRGGLGSFGQRSAFGAVPFIHTNNHQIQATAFSETFDGDYPYKSLSTLQESTRHRTDMAIQRGTLSGQHKFRKTTLAYRAIYAQEFGSGPGSEVFQDSLMSRKNGELYGLKVNHHISHSLSVTASNSFVRARNSTLNDSTNTKTYTDAYQNLTGIDATYRFDQNSDIHFLFDAKEDFFSYSSSTDVRTSEKSYEPGIIIETPFAENIRLLAGTRYLPEFGVVNKALGFREVYDQRQKWLTYSEGFSKPTLSDKYSQDPSFIGNPDLKPEESKQVELGASQTSNRFAKKWEERISYSTSVFSTSFEKLFAFEQSGATSTKKNLDSANAFGVDASAGYPFSLWGVEAGLSYVEVTARGRPIANVQEQMGYLAITHYFGPLVFELRDNQVIYRYGRGSGDTWEWNTLDFTFRTVGLNNWNVHGGGLNLFDQSKMFVKDYPEPQRRFFLSIERVF